MLYPTDTVLFSEFYVWMQTWQKVTVFWKTAKREKKTKLDCY